MGTILAFAWGDESRSYIPSAQPITQLPPGTGTRLQQPAMPQAARKGTCKTHEKEKNLGKIREELCAASLFWNTATWDMFVTLHRQINRFRNWHTSQTWRTYQCTRMLIAMCRNPEIWRLIACSHGSGFYSSLSSTSKRERETETEILTADFTASQPVGHGIHWPELRAH